MAWSVTAVFLTLAALNCHAQQGPVGSQPPGQALPPWPNHPAFQMPVAQTQQPAGIPGPSAQPGQGQPGLEQPGFLQPGLTPSQPAPSAQPTETPPQQAQPAATPSPVQTQAPTQQVVTIPPQTRLPPPRQPTLSYCIGRPFNPMYHTCCAGMLTPRPLGTRRPSCCGAVSFNNITHGCCLGATARVFDRRIAQCCSGYVNTNGPASLFQCCFDQAFERHKDYLCCAGEVKNGRRGVDACCGHETFELQNHACCADHTIYEPQDEMCCNGQIVGEPALENECCGADIIELGQELRCCRPQLRPGQNINFLPIAMRGHKYDIMSQSCCAGWVVPGSEMNHFCCGRRTLPRYGTLACCGGNAVYDISSHICCQGTVSQRTSNNVMCCGRRTIDLTNNKNLNCCNDSLYDMTKQTCCNQRLTAGLSCF